MDGSGPVIAERSAANDATPPKRSRKRVLLAAAGLVALGAAGFYGQEWWRVGRFVESTDDAYVQSDMVAVAPRIAGQVAEVLVADNQLVHRGDVLARLDDRDLRAALAQARADVAAAEADINALQAQLRLQASTIATADADVTSADAALAFARAEFARYTDLARTGNGSVQRAQQTDSDIRTRDAAATRARAAAEGARQQVGVLQAQLSRAQATRLRAQAAAQQAELNLSYATITAPTDGAIGDRTVRPGQYVQPGARLLSLVPMEASLYVVANFKETQLARMGRGEEVALDVDMLGGKGLRGTVDSLAPGSGSTFALLPPENATGNFTKIVQRVPVRIRLLPDERLSQLRPGLSVTAKVDTRTAPPGKLQTLADARS
ncbi:MAG TPA: HlyD family secretion protein [Rhodopila sp.]|nr:HlyD family secretion protein [Rhodopila sp.]